MSQENPISDELFNVLACPKCKSDLEYNDKKTHLVCNSCKKEYEIKTEFQF